MGKFRKKPLVIEAVQWDGGNWQEIYTFAHPNARINTNGDMYITTLEGELLASPLDWIIKGVQGEFYPIKPSIFEATYEEVS